MSLYKYICVTVLLIVILIYIFRYIKISEKLFIFGFAAIAIVSKVAIALIINANPVSDFLLMFNAAKQVTAGDFTFQNSPYFFYWAYQTGFVLYEALIVKLFGDSTTALLIINGLVMAAINILMYFFIKQMTKDVRSAMFGAVLYFIYPAPYFLISVLTNQHLSLLLILFGLYMIIKSEKNRDFSQTGTRILRRRNESACVASGFTRAFKDTFVAENSDYRSSIVGGILIAFGNIFRPIGIVPVVSIVSYYIVLSLEVADRKECFKKFGHLMSFIISYALIGMIASSVVAATGINMHGLKNNDPYWKFMVGLNVDSYGGYSEELISAVSQAKTLEERYQIENILISESLSKIKMNPISFFGEKSYRMWAMYESRSLSFGKEASKGRSERENAWWQNTVDRVVKLDKCYYLFLFLIALIVVVFTMVQKNINPHFLLCALIFLLYYGIHLIIETQPRYRDFAMPFVCILASGVVSVLPNLGSVEK
jgi:hypothetical protein